MVVTTRGQTKKQKTSKDKGDELAAGSQQDVVPIPGINYESVDLITPLPENCLVEISQYLPKTSRALFAVALTAPPSSYSKHGLDRTVSSSSRAIIAAGVEAKASH